MERQYLGRKNVLGQEKAPPLAKILLKHSKSKEVLRPGRTSPGRKSLLGGKL